LTHRVAILGATGAVGGTMVRVLEERAYPLTDLVLLSTQRSAGRRIAFRGREIEVREAAPDAFAGVDVALFSAGAGASREWAPHARAHGATVIDNSQAFRLDDGVPLVVPEVNPAALVDHGGLIANPNCSTIQLVLALAPLHRAWGLERVVVATYQSVSGTGAEALEELDAEIAADRDGTTYTPRVYAHPVAYNVIPHVDDALDGGSCREEMKLVWESRKILGLPELRLAATTVRVPVRVAHSEAVAIEFARRPDPDEARRILASAPGVAVVDDPSLHAYPTPLAAAGRDEAFVGRIRRDPSHEKGLLLFIACDNLRKGAALNAVQIAETLRRPAGVVPAS